MQLGVGGQQYSSQSGKPCLFPISWYCHELESLTEPIRETDGQNSGPPSSMGAWSTDYEPQEGAECREFCRQGSRFFAGKL